MYPRREGALRWRGVPRQYVAREAHGGGKSLLASRLRPLSSKATHPPNYRSLHSGDGGRDGEGKTSRLVGVEK